MENIKEQFIKELINVLKDENEDRKYYEKRVLNIPYMVSALDQQLKNCTEFINELKNKKWVINGYDEDSTEGYTNGKIRILIEKENPESDYMIDTYEDYCYYIEFLYDERHWGYCDCNEEDQFYSKKYKCCGIGCDWNAPAFRITKEINLSYEKWDGYEKDYWEYEERYYSTSEEEKLAKEQLEKEQRQKYLEDSIFKMQQELEMLKFQC